MEQGKAETESQEAQEMAAEGNGKDYKVKNNFYFLFRLAETVKKEFYDHAGTLRIALSSQSVEESASTWIPVDKWKLSGVTEKGLETIKEFPGICFSIYDLGLLPKGGHLRDYQEVCRADV